MEVCGDIIPLKRQVCGSMKEECEAWRCRRVHEGRRCCKGSRHLRGMRLVEMRGGGLLHLSHCRLWCTCNRCICHFSSSMGLLVQWYFSLFFIMQHNTEQCRQLPMCKCWADRLYHDWLSVHILPWLRCNGEILRSCMGLMHVGIVSWDFFLFKKGAANYDTRFFFPRCCSEAPLYTSWLKW